MIFSINKIDMYNSAYFVNRFVMGMCTYASYICTYVCTYIQYLCTYIRKCMRTYNNVLPISDVYIYGEIFLIQHSMGFERSV